MPKSKTRTRVAKKSLTKKSGYKFHWWMAVVLVAVIAGAGILILRFGRAATMVDRSQYTAAADGQSIEYKDVIDNAVLRMQSNGAQMSNADFASAYLGSATSTIRPTTLCPTPPNTSNGCPVYPNRGTYQQENGLVSKSWYVTSTPDGGADKTVWQAPTGSSGVTTAALDIFAQNGNAGYGIFCALIKTNPSSPTEENLTNVNLRIEKSNQTYPFNYYEPFTPVTVAEANNISLDHNKFSTINYNVPGFTSDPLYTSFQYAYRPVCVAMRLQPNEHYYLRGVLEVPNIKDATNTVRVEALPMTIATLNRPYFTTALEWPVKKDFKRPFPSRISQCWGGPNGPSYDAATNNSQNNRPDGLHPGIDLPVASGTPLYAAADGVVESAASTGDGYGLRVIIKHPQLNLWTVYAHMNNISVTQGATIKQGDQIGVSGNTGSSNGAHLHFIVQNLGGRATGSGDMLANGSSTKNLNPLNYLPPNVVNEIGCKRT